MSRRIAYITAFAYTALIAIPAVADPECFDNCRMPDVVDAQPAADSNAAAIDVAESNDGATESIKPTPLVQTPLVDAVPPPVPAPRAKVAARPAPLRPRMVVDPAPNNAEKPEPRYSAAAAPRNPAKPAARPQRKPDAAPLQQDEPVQIAARADSRPLLRIAAAPQRIDAAERESSNGGIVVVAPNVYAAGGSVTIYPGATPDPAWKPCQTEGRNYHPCGSYSYHSYGAGGYRPLGNYQPYAGTVVQVAVPNAHVIHIETED